MSEFLARLKQRKLVQWALAYIAFAFALLQGADIVAQRFAWPDAIERVLNLTLSVGFFVALVVTWYHGERGAQRVSGVELLILALLLAIGGGALWRFARTPEVAPAAVASASAPESAASATPAQSIPAKSIAVLPFENLSDDKKNDYFVAGMQDLILTKLADIGDLKVISRASTAKYASHPDDLKTIGRQLGVATILEGSVQKAGEQVLVNVQLVDTTNDSHLWAQSYQRKLDDIFGVEGEIAGQIATALHAKLSPAESANVAAIPTKNDAAYDLFLRAEYLANKGWVSNDTATMKVAVPLYRQAAGRDPNFALAYARLSFVESALVMLGGAGEEAPRLNLQARADAERALALQPDLAAAHLAIGFSDYYGRSDYAAALQAFAMALKLKPNDTEALMARGYVERRQGRFEDAFASFQQALTLDPRSSIMNVELSDTYMSVMRYTEAEPFLQRAMTLDPGNFDAKVDYSRAILFATGDIERALSVVQGDDPQLKLQRAFLLTLRRQYREALALLDGVPDTPDNFPVAATTGFGLKLQLQGDLFRLIGDGPRAERLYAQALPLLRARLKTQSGINLAFAWQYLAGAQIGLGQITAGQDSIAKSLQLVDDIGDRFVGPRLRVLVAQRHAQARRPDLAVPLLAQVIATPGSGYYCAPVML